jgi:putative tryptophan/tyrosine transport system substrate-binding protein
MIARREFIVGLGSVAVWPVVARGQRSATPVIGYIGAGTRESHREVIPGFYRGLMESGYIENRNLLVEYRWAEDRLEELPAFAADLVGRRVSVIVTLQSTAAALAAKAATKTIPIVFGVGTDPVDVGLVNSLNDPGGNITGISNLVNVVAAKRLEMLHELVPTATRIAALINPADRVIAENETAELQAAARMLGVTLLILKASDPYEFEEAFATLDREGSGGLLIGGHSLFSTEYDRLIALAARRRVPTMYFRREATAAGGLMSYGTDFPDAWRLAGTYVGRILNGERPANLPVQLVTKMQLAINMKTAKALGIDFPLTILGRADEVIE